MNSGKHKMNKRVQEYLDQKAKERDEQRRKKKEALLELGLFEKEYYDPEHPNGNHDYSRYSVIAFAASVRVSKCVLLMHSTLSTCRRYRRACLGGSYSE